MKLPETISKNFEPPLLREIELKGRVQTAQAGESVIRVGQAVRKMPLLLEGTIRVSRIDQHGHELLLYYIHANESCAMTFTCCMQPSPSEISAVAETDISYVSIPVTVMDDWLSKYPGWKNFVMRTIRQRFEELLEAIDQLAFGKLDERLVHYLKEKSRAGGSTTIHLSHEQIAHDLASSREVISRLLKRLENDRKVLLYRNEIKILPAL